MNRRGRNDLSTDNFLLRQPSSCAPQMFARTRADSRITTKTYESPAIEYQARLMDVLRQLIPKRHDTRLYGDNRIERMVRFIDTHRADVDCDIESVCRELKLDISVDYAGRLFRKLTGVRVRDYAEQKRMMIAAERLRQTDLPVKTIAAETGYDDTSHFIRRFKCFFRLSPVEFRKTAGAQNASQLVVARTTQGETECRSTN
jgi:AraC-like DNA-binding protein